MLQHVATNEVNELETPPPEAAANWHHHTDWISGNNLPEPYLPRNQQPRDRDGRGRESAKIRQNTEQMIRNDPPAAQRV